MINKKKDGSLYHDYSSITPILNSTGEIINFVSFKRDVSQSIEFEKAVVESENRLKAILNYFPDIILLMDENQIIHELFTAREDLLWIPRKNIQGRYLIEILEGEVYDQINEIIQNLTQFNKPKEIEIKMGEQKYFSIHISKIKSFNGMPFQYVFVLRDITAKKELEIIKEDVNHIIQHNLKNPVNAIIGFSELLLSESLSTENRQMISFIHESGHKIHGIIDQSLDLLKIEKGIYKLQTESLNLIDIFNKINKEFLPLQNDSSIKLDYYINNKPISWSDQYPVTGEKRLLEDMLGNLIINAFESSNSGEKITISIDENSHYHLIDIHNQGVIPEEIRDRFFDRYVTHGKKKGTGLGTYSAQLIAKAHKGYIFYKSSNSGGTHITISLPKNEFWNI